MEAIVTRLRTFDPVHSFRPSTTAAIGNRRITKLFAAHGQQLKHCAERPTTSPTVPPPDDRPVDSTWVRYVQCQKSCPERVRYSDRRWMLIVVRGGVLLIVGLRPWQVNAPAQSAGAPV